MPGCEAKCRRAFRLWGFGDDFGDVGEGLVDVGAEAVGVEDHVELAVGDFTATVIELCGRAHGDDVGGADQVDLVLASLLVGFSEALELPDGAVYIAVPCSVNISKMLRVELDLTP